MSYGNENVYFHEGIIINQTIKGEKVMSIKATDLRIGNLVKDDRGNIIKVKSINQAGINEDWDGPANESEKTYKLIPGESLEDCDPIPLTPEILEKCGFERVYQSLKLGQWYLYDGPDTEGYWWFKTSEAHDFTVKLKYLHQLQSLYFALTAEEITVNL